MRRSLISAFLVLATALALVGFTLSRATRGLADFRFVNGPEPRTLDPGMMTGEPEGRVADAIFEGLTRLAARSLEPEPGVAQSWDVSPDGITYTFHLRKDARWSDGRPVTAHDFCYAWRRLQDPSQGAEYAYIMHMVRFAEALNTYGAQSEALAGPVKAALAQLAARFPGSVPDRALRELESKHRLNALLKGSPNPRLRTFLTRSERDLSQAELADLSLAVAEESARQRTLHAEAERRFGVDAGVFATDERTLVVELIAPTPYFLQLTAFYPFYPVPRWAIERARRDWFLPGKIVSNGAFNLVDWRVGDRIRLERSPTYWGKRDVALASVDVLSLENTTTALNLYLTGDVDWLPHNNYPQDLGPDLADRADFYNGPALIAYFYRINCKRKPFDDPRVRKAINLAIDREQITRDVLRLGQLPATHFVPPGIAGYTPPPTEIRYDAEAARRLLAEAGFPGGKGFPQFGILYNTLEAHKKLAEVIADQLRRNLNIDAKAYNQEWQSYLQSTRSFDYDVARGGWVGDYEDPNTFLDIWVTGGGNNQTGWSHPAYDRLIDAAANTDRFLADPDFFLAHSHDRSTLEARYAEVRKRADGQPRLEALAALRSTLLSEAEGVLLRDEFPIIPLYFYVISGLVRPGIRGFYAELVGSDGKKRHNLRDLHPLRDISLATSARGAP